MNLIEYVRSEGEASFAEKPLNDVDGVILAQLAYMNFDFLYSRAIHSIGDLTNNATIRGAMRGTWDEKGNIALLRELKRSVRFGHVQWSFYKNHLDPLEEQQFTAITLNMGNDQYYLSFRGTSAELLDWKEDLNMTFLRSVPSQRSALHYFEKVAARLGTGKDVTYYLGGHSKGGNLAVYAAVHAPDELQRAIRGIYSVDGPGIKESIDPDIVDKVHKLIPESSIVGLLLEPDTHYTVVSSNGRGIYQHDPFTWDVVKDEFRTVDSITSFSRFREDSVAEWLERVDDETKQEFLSSLFAVFAAARYSQVQDVTDDMRATVRYINRKVRSMDPQGRAKWRAVTNAFVGSIVEQARVRIAASSSAALDSGQALLGTVGQAVGSAMHRSVDTVRSAHLSLPKFGRMQGQTTTEQDAK